MPRRPSAGSRASTPRRRAPRGPRGSTAGCPLTAPPPPRPPPPPPAPAVREVARGQAIAARVGIGPGEQVAEGRFARALELPPPPAPRRRSAALRPEERLAALLAGRDVPLASEELALRARADLAAGREREAALQLRVALAAALGELAPWAPRGDLRARIEELRTLQPAAEAAAAAALQGGLDDGARADVERVLGRLEAALRARTALGFD